MSVGAFNDHVITSGPVTFWAMEEKDSTQILIQAEIKAESGDIVTLYSGNNLDELPLEKLSKEEIFQKSKAKIRTSFGSLFCALK